MFQYNKTKLKNYPYKFKYYPYKINQNSTLLSVEIKYYP